MPPSKVVKSHSDIKLRALSSEKFGDEPVFGIGRPSTDFEDRVAFVLTPTRLLNDLIQMATIITLYLELSLEIPFSISIIMAQVETPDTIIETKTVTKNTVSEITAILNEYVESKACEMKGCTYTKFMPNHSPKIGSALLKAATYVGESGTIIMLSSFDVYPPPSEFDMLQQTLSAMSIYFHRFVIGRGIESGVNWMTKLTTITSGVNIDSFTKWIKSSQPDTDFPIADVILLFNSPHIHYNQVNSVLYEETEWLVPLFGQASVLVIYIVKSDGTPIDANTLNVSLIGAIKLVSPSGETCARCV